MPHIPVHPSAEKRHRQSLKRRVRNHAIKTRVRTVTKNALDAFAGKDPATATTALEQAMKILFRAVSKGTIRKNTASRKVARLSKRLHRAQAATTSSGATQS